MDPQRMISGDSTLVEKIVSYLKSKGIFDEFRHECLADVDTKSSCQNLSQRVDGYAAKFLANETWHPDLNKNELRNKLRRHIDESGMLAVGADHVVEQVINPKIHQLFLPKIIEVVHQYMKEQNEFFNKKPETSFSDNTTSENVSDAPDSNKGKTSALDPIADILSFSSLKSKTPSASASNTTSKTDNVLPKHTDVSKTEKKKEEKSTPISEKNVLESPSENPVTPTVSEGKSQIDKEKIKKEEPESSPEISKKSVKDESKPEKKKSEDTKPQTTEINTNAEENKPSTSVSAKPIGSDKKDAEENKASAPVSAKPSSTVKKEVEEGKASASSSSKPSSSSKKDVDRSKLKSKSSNIHKTSSSSSGEAKKPKKESSDKSSDKYVKSKSSKPSKDLSSPSKSVASSKNSSKEEKGGEISKSKSSDSSSSKTSESSVKKPSKSSSSKKDHISSKHKSHSEKTEKYKASKTSDKKEQNITESSSSEKGNKNVQYSSSYDSSQGSDQDKSSSSSLNRDRQKHFSKHAKKENSDKSLNKSSDTSSQKRKVKETVESPTKKLKNETNSTQEKFKESITLEEAAKISSRSNSFGSTSSVSSSSNTSKDNVVSNSDETSESCGKDKKKKQPKDKEACHNLKKLPPPPPPPPPSSSLSCELTSADISSLEDTQSSSDHEHSSSNESSDESSSESEPESKALNTLNETLLNNSSSDDINEFYDIFLYSSSSSEFEGFGDSPEKQDQPEKINESDVSVSSVHTSDLSSFDDELSDDDFFINNESQPGKKKRLTLKEAEKLLKSKALLQSFDRNKSTPVKNKLDDVSSNKTFIQKSSHLSSEDESSPSEPKRSLRRERKLNPRYASSEYTSIFNSRKETFITKQSSPYVKNQAPNSSPKSESKLKKEPNLDTDKSLKKNSLTQTKVDTAHQDSDIKITERSLRAKRKSSAKVGEDKIFSENSKMSSSDELDSFMDKEKLFQENDKSCQISGSKQFKRHFKFKSQNNSNFSVNSYSVKRKLTEAEEASPAKRPCSRASVDSTSSECVPNENKPFNSEKHSSSDEKITKSSDFKGSDLTDTIKKDMFCKQRTNNNGDILGQKDIFSKPSRGKVVNASEKK